eukprot:4543442-Pleurochrysis_carterae.AAC.1
MVLSTYVVEGETGTFARVRARGSRAARVNFIYACCIDCVASDHTVFSSLRLGREKGTQRARERVPMQTSRLIRGDHAPFLPVRSSVRRLGSPL